VGFVGRAQKLLSFYKNSVLSACLKFLDFRHNTKSFRRNGIFVVWRVNISSPFHRNGIPSVLDTVPIERLRFYLAFLQRCRSYTAERLLLIKVNIWMFLPQLASSPTAAAEYVPKPYHSFHRSLLARTPTRAKGGARRRKFFTAETRSYMPCDSASLRRIRITFGGKIFFHPFDTTRSTNQPTYRPLHASPPA